MKKAWNKYFIPHLRFSVYFSLFSSICHLFCFCGIFFSTRQWINILVGSFFMLFRHLECTCCWLCNICLTLSITHHQIFKYVDKLFIIILKGRWNYTHESSMYFFKYDHELDSNKWFSVYKYIFRDLGFSNKELKCSEPWFLSSSLFLKSQDVNAKLKVE